MLLTIGMIVKNEEKYLERCLEAIKPILDNVDSELIITDTGSTDNTVAIAEKYTKNVLHFDWYDDFAAARNYGLKKAKGKWFMFLDADEIFESCDGIIKFFNEGEYKNYNSATFTVRNIFAGDNNYTDFMASRLTKIFSDTKFSGIIHEYLTHFTQPIKNIPDVALHYGYLFVTKEQTKFKAERNLKLLMECYDENNIVNPMIFKEIYDSYCVVGEKERGTVYLDKGLMHCKKTHSLYAATYYCCKVFDAYYADDIKEVERLVGEYFDWKKTEKLKTITTDVEVYAIYGESLYNHLNFKGAMDAIGIFFDIYEEVKEGKINTHDASALNLRAAIDKNISDYFYDFLDCCDKCGEYDKAIHYLTHFNIGKYPVNSHNDVCDLSEKIVKIIDGASYNGGYNVYRNLGVKCRELMANSIISNLYVSDKKTEILDLLDDIGKENERIGKKTDIYRSYFTDGIVDVFKLERYILLYGLMQNIDLIAIAMDKQKDISFMLSAGDFDMQKCAYLCCRNFVGFYEIAENYNAANVVEPRALPDVLKFYDYCISMKLLDNEDKTSEEKEKLIAGLYKVKTAIKNKLNKTEFEKMALSIKQSIRKSINDGKLADAKQTLTKYQQINPNDGDIQELLKLMQ